MDKFLNTFGLGLAVVLASTLAVQAPSRIKESQWVPPAAAEVADPIAAQGNAAVRAIEEDARLGARAAKAAALPQLSSLEIAQR
jgi:hypothetical protein